MAQTHSVRKRIRRSYGRIREVAQMPNLIEVQRESYEQFLRSNKEIDYVSGLEKTLRSVFPIRDFAGTAELDFVHYELEAPKYDIVECRQRGITYAAPMKVTLRLVREGRGRIVRSVMAGGQLRHLLEGTVERGSIVGDRAFIEEDVQRVSVFADIKKKHASHAISADITVADADGTPMQAPTLGLALSVSPYVYAQCLPTRVVSDRDAVIAPSSAALVDASSLRTSSFTLSV